MSELIHSVSKSRMGDVDLVQVDRSLEAESEDSALLDLEGRHYSLLDRVVEDDPAFSGGLVERTTYLIWSETNANKAAA